MWWKKVWLVVTDETSWDQLYYWSNILPSYVIVSNLRSRSSLGRLLARCMRLLWSIPRLFRAGSCRDICDWFIDCSDWVLGILNSSAITFGHRFTIIVDCKYNVFNYYCYNITMRQDWQCTGPYTSHSWWCQAFCIFRKSQTIKGFLPFLAWKKSQQPSSQDVCLL